MTGSLCCLAFERQIGALGAWDAGAVGDEADQLTALQWVPMPTHLMLVFGVPPVLPPLDLDEGCMVSGGVFWCKMNGALLLVQSVFCSLQATGTPDG